MKTAPHRRRGVGSCAADVVAQGCRRGNRNARDRVGNLELPM